jgi:hypothetical protein
MLSLHKANRMITGVILTRNEEHHIVECISAIRTARAAVSRSIWQVPRAM